MSGDRTYDGDRTRTLGVTSFGLWRRRADLAGLFPGHRVVPPVWRADTYAGWGWRSSGLRAARRARNGGGLALLEDGFLCGFSAKLREPIASYTIDSVAPHYDGTRASDLERWIAAEGVNDGGVERAREAMARIVQTGLSKWNDQPVRTPRSLGITGSYLLLIDQVAGDLSLQYGTPPDAFERLLAAARAEANGRTLVLRAHPVAPGPLASLCQEASDVTILGEPCQLAPLLASADGVYTVSSQAGFEALLHGGSVRCFGTPFYSGWGLTKDDEPIPRRSARPTLEHVFACAYVRANRYLDLHTRTPVEIGEAIEQLLHMRDVRMGMARRVVTLGMSPWKRRAVEPFLIGPGGRPKHARRLPPDFEGDAVVWGADAPDIAHPNVRTVRLEDGPLRSRGLGAALRFPCSLVRTDDPLPFDARRVNVVERSLREQPPGEAERQRATDLRQRLVATRATKYMLDKRPNEPLPREERERVLVVGQVEGDASLRYGAPGIATNDALLCAVRDLYPEAFIAYRDHPDVRAGLRPGRASRRHVDLDVTDHDLNDLLDWCNRVETITSGTGFEALLRGVRVGTHGWPFYAGWGLTDDRLARSPRGVCDLDALVAVTMLRVPVYIHPSSRLPSVPERLIDALGNASPSRIGEPLRQFAGTLAGRAIHMWRGRLRRTQ